MDELIDWFSSILSAAVISLILHPAPRCWFLKVKNMIPPRKPADQLKDKDVRWYVHTKSSVKQAMTDEAFRRGVDLWTLGGAVLASWLQAGCPDFPVGTSELPIPAPSPSSSIAGPKEPEA